MTPGLVAAVVVLVGAGVALAVVDRRRPRRGADVVLAAALGMVLATTLLPTHPAVGIVGQQWQPVLGHGGGGSAWRELVAGDWGVALTTVVLDVAVYVPLGIALAAARPRRPAWLAVPVVVAVAVELVQYQWLDRVAALDDVVIEVATAVVAWSLTTLVVRGGRAVAVDE